MHPGTRLLLLAMALAMTGCTTLEKQFAKGGSLGQVDKDYIATEYQLVQIDNLEGKLAATRATDPRVKFLSTQMMDQANSLNPGLQAALQAEGVAPPNQLPPEITASVEKLRTLSGKAFDRQYVADELAIHQRAASVFKQEAAGTHSDAIRDQVQAQLPVVEDNLNKLKGLSSDLNGQPG